MRKIVRGVFLIFLSLLPVLGLPANLVRAQDETPPAPTPSYRHATFAIDVDFYTWWLIRWKDNSTACEIVIDHPDFPTGDEILLACGEDIYEDWFDTQPCSPGEENDYSQCEGVYLHLAAQEKGQKTIELNLPLPEAWVTLGGCEPRPASNRCSTPPKLLITAAEPLPNENIIRIQGSIGNDHFSCPGDRCEVPLAPTGYQGTQVEFWADSSFGDSTEHYTALVRVLAWGDFMAPEGRRGDSREWTVDILSDRWRGAHPASCAQIWQVFPEVGGPSGWLTTPKDASGLESTLSYYYLAGMLIQNGVVDAGGCPNHGLQGDLIANTCGMQAAMPQVLEWQNRFDRQILEVARNTGVPAQLLKNIFGRESQLWPGIYKIYHESGLGQLTEYGADTILLWNTSFYNQFCPLVLHQSACDLGFAHLGVQEQNLLRGALVRQMDATCPSCAEGIDLSQVNFSVNAFAEGLLANCEQVSRIIFNITGRKAGQATSYEDLWRFTLVNYNRGAGCLANAVQQTWIRGQDLTWGNVSTNLEGDCQQAIAYVEDISQEVRRTPTPTPWLRFITPSPGTLPAPVGGTPFPPIPETPYFGRQTPFVSPTLFETPIPYP